MAGFYYPCMKYTITKQNDGEGGIKETLSDPTRINVAVRVHENIVMASVKYKTAVVPEDILLLRDGFYRVIKVITLPPSDTKQLYLERLQKPIYPN